MINEGSYLKVIYRNEREAHKKKKTATDWEGRANKKGKTYKNSNTYSQIQFWYKHRSNLSKSNFTNKKVQQTRIVEVRLKRGPTFLDLHSNFTHAITCK